MKCAYKLTRCFLLIIMILNSFLNKFRKMFGFLQIFQNLMFKNRSYSLV